jgi:DNA-binding response OmpR family regulator
MQVAQLIVAIDDDPDFRILVHELLGWEGYRVMTIDEQGGAYEQLHALRPDLLILDLVLEHPDSGWAILEEVRRDADLAAMQVIVCTADVHGIEDRAADLQRFQAEALIKPFHIEEMRAHVRRLIGPATETGR